MDAFSVAASVSQVVFSGFEFMRLQRKVDDAQKKEDDRLGKKSLIARRAIFFEFPSDTIFELRFTFVRILYGFL